MLAHWRAARLVMIFALWRLTIKKRPARGVPPAIEASKLQGILAKLNHVGLYALMILMPVSGPVGVVRQVEAAAQGHNG